MTHDPMLDGMDRYIVPAMSMTNVEDTWPCKPHEREVVLLSDLPALIAKVREDERVGKPDPGIDERQAYALAEAYKNGREQGQRDEREAAAQRVSTVCQSRHGYTPGQTCPYCTDAIAAIRARGEKS